MIRARRESITKAGRCTGSSGNATVIDWHLREALAPLSIESPAADRLAFEARTLTAEAVNARTRRLRRTGWAKPRHLQPPDLVGQLPPRRVASVRRHPPARRSPISGRPPRRGQVHAAARRARGRRRRPGPRTRRTRLTRTHVRSCPQVVPTCGETHVRPWIEPRLPDWLTRVLLGLAQPPTYRRPDGYTP